MVANPLHSFSPNDSKTTPYILSTDPITIHPSSDNPPLFLKRHSTPISNRLSINSGLNYNHSHHYPKDSSISSSCRQRHGNHPHNSNAPQNTSHMASSKSFSLTNSDRFFLQNQFPQQVPPPNIVLNDHDDLATSEHHHHYPPQSIKAPPDPRVAFTTSTPPDSCQPSMWKSSGYFSSPPANKDFHTSSSQFFSPEPRYYFRTSPGVHLHDHHPDYLPNEISLIPTPPCNSTSPPNDPSHLLHPPSICLIAESSEGPFSPPSYSSSHVSPSLPVPDCQHLSVEHIPTYPITPLSPEYFALSTPSLTSTPSQTPPPPFMYHALSNVDVTTNMSACHQIPVASNNQSHLSSNPSQLENSHSANLNPLPTLTSNGDFDTNGVDGEETFCARLNRLCGSSESTVLDAERPPSNDIVSLSLLNLLELPNRHSSDTVSADHYFSHQNPLQNVIAPQSNLSLTNLNQNNTFGPDILSLSSPGNVNDLGSTSHQPLNITTDNTAILSAQVNVPVANGGRNQLFVPSMSDPSVTCIDNANDYISDKPTMSIAQTFSNINHPSADHLPHYLSESRHESSYSDIIDENTDDDDDVDEYDGEMDSFDEEEVVPGEDVSEFLNCHKIWHKIKSLPAPKCQSIDIDELCSQLQAKARCSESGVVVKRRDVDACLAKLTHSES